MHKYTLKHAHAHIQMGPSGQQLHCDAALFSCISFLSVKLCVFVCMYVCCVYVSVFVCV